MGPRNYFGKLKDPLEGRVPCSTGTPPFTGAEPFAWAEPFAGAPI